MSYQTERLVPRGLATIPDVKVAMATGFQIFRRQVAPPALGMQGLPLISGTEPFVPDSLVDWHSGYQNGDERDVACYYMMDAVVSGAGQVWVGDHLITSPEIMPPYVANVLDIANGGNNGLHSSAKLPIRTIEAPCLVAIGHGIHVYGHFLIELLFRLLVAHRAFFQSECIPYRILLDWAAPKWLLKILEENFGIGPADVEFFFPEREQVLLRHAFVPTRLFQDDMINPFANDLIADLLDRLNIQSEARPLRRIFVARNRFHNPKAPHRICVNEPSLIATAVEHYGFTSVTMETMTWLQQIALFQQAEIIVGQAGSGLHNALFSRPGSRLASIGFMNLVQSEIGALRGQHNAFWMKGIELKGEFRVDEEMFGTFLARVCA